MVPAARWAVVLVREELRKLGRPALLAGLLALCLLLNGALLWGRSWLAPYAAEAAAVTRAVGPCMGASMEEELRRRPASEARQLLVDAVADAQSTLASFDADAYGAQQAARIDHPAVAALMASKYRAWSHRVREAAVTAEDMDLYAGPATREVRGLLNGTMLPLVIAEASLAGMAAVLYLFELDGRTHAEAMVLASAAGQRSVWAKAAAAVLAALASYVVLTLVTLGACVVALGLDGLAASHVASQFNVIVEGMSARPVVMWSDFTVAGNVAATLAVGAVLVVAACLAAFGLVLLCGRRALVAAGVLGIMAVAAPVLSQELALQGLWGAFSLVSLTPPCLLLTCYQWFTDMGMFALVPWHETWGACVGAGLWAVSAWGVYRAFCKRSVAS